MDEKELLELLSQLTPEEIELVRKDIEDTYRRQRIRLVKPELAPKSRPQC